MMPSPRATARPHARQRGDILIVTLVFMLLLGLGVLLSMRSGVIRTAVTGNTLAVQKDAQVGDVALRQIEAQIMSAYPNGNLEGYASGQAWWRSTGGVPTAAPAATYWNTCLGNGDPTQRCGAVALALGGTPLPYNALVVVQPVGGAGIASITSTCSAGMNSSFYEIFVHVVETNGATAADTDTVFRFCSPA